MNKQTISRLRSSFAEITRRRPDVAALFYKRLFEVAPSVRRAFKGTPKDEQRELTKALAQVVASLEHTELLAAHLARIGQRHAAMHARPTHYKLFGDTLMWTFEQVLKRDFTAPLRAAWMLAYNTLAKSMMAAGQPPALPKPLALKAKRRPAVRRGKVAEGGKRKAARRPGGRGKVRAR